MPHPIPNQPKNDYKKGDRVQNIDSGNFGTVSQDQTDPLLVHIIWDAEPNVDVVHKADSVRVAPWHEINFKDYTRVGDPVAFIFDLNLADPNPSRFGGAVKAEPQHYKAPNDVNPIHLRNFSEAGLIKPDFIPNAERKYQKDDRVKLKYARRAGTVRGYHKDGQLVMEWDHASGIAKCPEGDVVPLHTPRDTDPANPNQDAIDAIEALRVPLKKEIEALQAKLGNLTSAKKLLERG